MLGKLTIRFSCNKDVFAWKLERPKKTARTGPRFWINIYNFRFLDNFTLGAQKQLMLDVYFVQEFTIALTSGLLLSTT